MAVDEKTIERLRASKNEWERQTKERGRQSGERWATAIATAPELDRLARAADPDVETGLACTVANYARTFFDTIRPGENTDAEISRFWEPWLLGPDDFCDDFVIGFAEAAIGVWDEAEGKL